MRMIKCDGCGKLSPNRDGKHIAHDWTKVVVREGQSPYEAELIFCLGCLDLPAVKGSMFTLQRRVVSLKDQLLHLIKWTRLVEKEPHDE